MFFFHFEIRNSRPLNKNRKLTKIEFSAWVHYTEDETFQLSSSKIKEFVFCQISWQVSNTSTDSPLFIFLLYSIN